MRKIITSTLLTLATVAALVVGAQPAHALTRSFHPCQGIIVGGHCYSNPAPAGPLHRSLSTSWTRSVR